MSTINWYPGHMYRTSKDIQKLTARVDLIIEILDARIPFSSRNPMLMAMRGDKPCISVLAKCDLADPALTAKWQRYLEKKQGVKTMTATIKQPEKMRDLLMLCRRMMPQKSIKSSRIEAMIVGIPNVGKSTMINILSGRVLAKTGNEAAVTKQIQRIKLSQDVLLLDTPGVLWPKVKNKHSSYRLAITGAIKATAINHDEIALYMVNYLRKVYPDAVKRRYRLNELPEDDLALLNTIGAKRGCLVAGGTIDLDRTASIVLTEFRSGAIGRITLETPEMMEREAGDHK